MEYGSRSTLLAMALLGFGCGGNDDPGTSDSGTDSDEGTATMTGTGTMSGSGTAPTTLNTDSAEGGSESSGPEGSSSSGGAQEVMLGGYTQDFIGIEAIPGTEIRVFGMETITATADGSGSFQLGPLPADTPVALVLDPITADAIDYVGSIVPERTGTADRNDVIARQVNQTLIDEQIMGIQDQMPQMANLDEAIVIVMVSRMTAASPLADGTVTVEMDPPPEAGTYYAPDATGEPILDSTEIGYQLIPAAVFFNLPDTQPGEITVTATHESALWTCAVDHPQWPTLGSYTTLVFVTCEMG